jgi:diguanylate cyclase (GGDEF)-like protein
VSIGVAARNGRFDTPQSVIEAADRALYRAKERGRNRLSR